jgi:outer membrane protease
MFRARRLFGGMLALGLAVAGSPSSANPFLIENTEAPAFTSSFALRYWYGMGSTSKDLYGFTRDTLVSRLTYDGLQSHTAEAFTRVDHSSGLFWKGYAGGGLLTRGNLQDEDFPPVITPYSSTNSTLQNQAIGYASVDFGGALLRGPDFRIDGFVGYHYLHTRLKAFGCQQTATNPAVCAGGIPNDVAVIVEDDTWQALRLGLNADFPIVDRLRLNLEAAWLPYVWFSGTDNHLLRPDLPVPTPEDGHGWGYQLEALLSYQIDNAMSVGVGGRYWQMQSKGGANFEVFGGSLQPLDFKTKIYGVFVQGSYRFGPL